MRLSAEQYRQVFEQDNEYYRNLVSLEVDHQCKNVGRISTIAYDENLYYNPMLRLLLSSWKKRNP